MSRRLSISVCPFGDGKFDVILKDPDTGEEVTLSGEHQLGQEEIDFLLDVAPACVMTTYRREE